MNELTKDQIQIINDNAEAYKSYSLDKTTKILYQEKVIKNDPWEDSCSPIFDFENFNYKIKPSPVIRPMTFEEIVRYRFFTFNNGCQNDIFTIQEIDLKAKSIKMNNCYFNLKKMMEFKASNDLINWYPCSVKE